MKSGDVFKLDTQSIQEVATFTKTPLVDVQKKLTAGDTYSVAKSDSGTGDVVRGSRWVDGKPKKGRPRRFPRATVLRLLGEKDDRPTTEETESASEAAEEEALEERAEELLAAVDAPEKTESSSSW
jgi:hypothetical protein